MKNVTWISFHSGYDFGYLLKVLTNDFMPPEEQQFLKMLKLFFPRFYDIKFLMKSCKTLKGGLQDVADDLGVIRVGVQHQAGSDSHLTCMAFFKLQRLYFEGHIDDTKYMNRLYGIGFTSSNPYALTSEGSSASFITSNIANNVSASNNSSAFTNLLPDLSIPAPDPNSILLGTPPKKK